MIIQFKQTPIFYKISGKGPAVVLLHGFLESSFMWKKLVSELSKTKTVIIIDLPGHGKSGVIAETHSMELMAESVDFVLEQLFIPSATLIGHSMGGYVALAFAENYPEKIEKLVLLNSVPTEDSPERKENRDRALEVFKKNPKAFISMAISNLFAEISREKFIDEIEASKKDAYDFPTEGITAAIKGMRKRKDRTSVLREFKKEKFMICALEDPLIPISEAEIIATKCGTGFKIVPSGHVSIIEEFDAVKNYLHLIL